MIVETDPWRLQRRFCHVPSGRVSDRLFDLTGGAEIDPAGLAWYLTLGYVPGTGTLFKDIVCLPAAARVAISPGSITVLERSGWERVELFDHGARSEADLLAACVDMLRSSLDTFFESADESVVIPLSAGLDSRAILGAALEHRQAGSIAAFTFGAPGAWDFDVPVGMARRLGIDHVAYDLERIQFDRERARDCVDLMDGVAHIGRPHDCIQQTFRGATAVLSGHFVRPESFSPPAGPPTRKFLEKGRFAFSIDDLASELTGQSISSDDLAALDVGLDGRTDCASADYGTLELYLRQERYVSHVVLPRGLLWQLPLANARWHGFWRGLPPKLRIDESFFLRILAQAYPRVMRFPARLNYPARLHGRMPVRRRIAMWARRQGARLGMGGRAPSRGPIEYIRYGVAFRERDDLKALAGENIAQLKRRQIVDNNAVDRIWREHQSGKADHWRAIAALVCLEAILELAEES